MLGGSLVEKDKRGVSVSRVSFHIMEGSDESNEVEFADSPAFEDIRPLAEEVNQAERM